MLSGVFMWMTINAGTQNCLVQMLPIIETESVKEIKRGSCGSLSNTLDYPRYGVFFFAQTMADLICARCPYCVPLIK